MRGGSDACSAAMDSGAAGMKVAEGAVGTASAGVGESAAPQCIGAAPCDDGDGDGGAGAGAGAAVGLAQCSRESAAVRCAGDAIQGVVPGTVAAMTGLVATLASPPSE